MPSEISVALVGCGRVAMSNHVPGVRAARGAELAVLCDTDGERLSEAARRTGVERTCADYRDVIADESVDAVVCATPNVHHAEVVKAAAAAGKHILCEKPLAMSLDEAVEMLSAVEEAGVRHMVAFTYRFVPAIRYMAHLVQTGAIGEPVHFRSRRMTSSPNRNLGWRQRAELAGTGMLGDYLSHRIDIAHLLVGPMREVMADMEIFAPQRDGERAEVEDWVVMLARFETHATGNLEATRWAVGATHHEGGVDVCEVNGREGSIIYSLQAPHELWFSRRGESSPRRQPVPDEFLVWPGADRDPHQGDPRLGFRSDQMVAFIESIRQQRECEPSFRDGVRVQAVMEAALRSHHERRWSRVDYPGQCAPR